MFTTTFAVFTVIVTLSASVPKVYCGDYIPDTLCATFSWKTPNRVYSHNLSDFFQSVDLYELHRYHEVTSHSPVTDNSVFIYKGCQLELCRLEYFRGTCNNLVNSNNNISLDVPEVWSARCTCQRVCDCRNIVIPKDLSENPILGRGYFEGRCSTCDTEYVALRTCDSAPVWQYHNLESIILRSGCTLIVYSQQNFNGEQRIIRESVFKEAIRVPSYKILCSDEDFVEPTKPPHNSSFPRKITLPRTKEEFYEMQKSDKTLEQHPGFAAAASSLEKKRSHGPGHVVIVGTHQASKSGFPQCQDGPTNQIGECRIPVSLDHLGLSTELRVITAPMRTEQAKYDLQTSLGEYLSKQEELKGLKPSTVIMYHELEDDYLDVNSSALQTKIQALLFNEERLLVHYNGNFQVVIDANGKSLIASDAAHYKALFSTVISKTFEPHWNLNTSLQRTCTSWTTDSKSHTYFVNGNAKIFSGEFWPRNLEECIVKRCEGTGDKLGAEVFKAVFRDNITPYGSIKQVKGTAGGDSNLQQPSAALCALS